MPPLRVGAYGLHLEGVHSRYLLDAPARWPVVRVARRERDGELCTRANVELGPERGRFALGRIEVRVEREARVADVVHVGALTDDDIAHPIAGVIASAFTQWDGGLGLHAGGVLVNGGVWGVIGASQAGKSTLLASLALAGHDVLADDMLVIRRGMIAAAGPRCIDLRPSTAEHLVGALETTPSRGGSRHRLALGSVPPEAPLRGWLVLEWGDSLATVQVGAAERVAVLGAAFKWRVAPHDPELLLDLATLPGRRVRRPRSWGAMDAAAAGVLAAATS